MSDSCAAGEFLTFSTPLSDLLPDHVFMSWDCVDRCSEPLHAQENEFIRTAVEKRRREYTAGRASARRALNAFAGMIIGHRRCCRQHRADSQDGRAKLCNDFHVFIPLRTNIDGV